ncbi:MAG: DMT family transporter [Ignavibacteriae bacterium]|nr:DMT family transporter [Ignavibacteriota bacterium]
MRPPPKHHTTSQHEQHTLLGITFTILAAISFTFMSLLGKIIGERASTDMILFARFFISLILILPWVVKKPQQIIHITHPSKIIFRSLFTFFAFVCFFYSLQFISLADALLLNNTFPLFIPLVTWCLLKAKTPHKVWMGIIVGFIGIALVLNPDPKLFQPISLIALFSGILAAIAIVVIRSLTKTTPTLQILFYNFLICSILSGIALPFRWKSLNINTLLLLFGVGLFGASYQFFSTLSFAKAPVRLTSPLMFLCIVFGVIADFIIWKHNPTLLTLIGMLCVVLGGIITIYFGQKELISNRKQ